MPTGTHDLLQRTSGGPLRQRRSKGPRICTWNIHLEMHPHNSLFKNYLNGSGVQYESNVSKIRTTIKIQYVIPNTNPYELLQGQ